MSEIIMRPAVFFDRDNTLLRYVPYLCRPDQVALEDDAAQALSDLRQHGYACVVVTNQSGLGIGMLTEADLARIHEEFRRQLAAAGAQIDGIYHNGIAGIGKNRTVIEHPDRKPGPGMLLRAARDLSLDIGKSWMVGDNVCDILAGHNAGCRGLIWIRHGNEPEELRPDEEIPACVRFSQVAHLSQAVQIILQTQP